MDPLRIEVQVYSPRRGHNDAYTIIFHDDGIKISGHEPKEANCRIIAGSEPHWSGHNEGTGNPLLNIMADDQIDAPPVIVMALEYAWAKWNKRAMHHTEITDAIKELFAWVDLVAKNRPKHTLWLEAF
jgi:hypothetical protein